MNPMRTTFRLAFLLLVTVAGRGALGAEVSIKGEAELKIRCDGSHGVVRQARAAVEGRLADGTVLEKTSAEVRVVDAAGAIIARLERGKSEPILSGAAGPVYRVKQEGEQTRLVGAADGKLVYRIKLKADKANLYDGTGARIRHVKAKEDGFGVKDEKDRPLMKIKGTATLAEAARLAVPLEWPYRLALWAAESSLLK